MTKINNLSIFGKGGTRYAVNKETATGDTWVDGKPIYMRTIYKKNLENKEILFDGTNDIDQLINYFGKATFDGEGVVIPYSDAGDIRLHAYIRNIQGKITFYKYRIEPTDIYNYFLHKIGGAINTLTKFKSSLFGKKAGVVYE